MSIFDQIGSAFASDFVSGTTVNPQYQPPQRTWVGLTDEDLERIKLLTFEKEINAEGEEQEAVNLDQLIRAAEQLCKEKNK